MGEDGEPRRRRSRGRRGGRNRNRRREEGDAGATPAESDATDATSNVIEPRQWNPPAREEAPAPAPAPAAQPAIIVQSTAHAANHSPAPDTPDEADKPKRRGWWSRMTEGS